METNSDTNNQGNNDQKNKKIVFKKSHCPEEPHTWTEEDEQEFAKNKKYERNDAHNIRDIDGRCGYLPEDHPEYKKHPSGTFVIDYFRPFFKKFLIDIRYCDVVEHTLLALAGVKEMPLEGCFFNDPAKFDKIKLDQLNELELEKLRENSIIFGIPLLNDDSLKLIEKFAKENDIEFNDYTHAYSEKDKQPNIKLIRLDAHSVLEKIFPTIIEYLETHEDDVKRHRDETHKILAIKNQESSGSYSWGRLFNKHTALAALTATVTVAAATMAFANRK